MSNLSNQGIPFYIRELVNSSFYEFVTPRYNAVRVREERRVYIEIVDDARWAWYAGVTHLNRKYLKRNIEWITVPYVKLSQFQNNF